LGGDLYVKNFVENDIYKFKIDSRVGVTIVNNAVDWIAYRSEFSRNWKSLLIWTRPNWYFCLSVRPFEMTAREGQQLCAVCGDIGNGVHFGAITCEGCKVGHNDIESFMLWCIVFLCVTWYYIYQCYWTLILPCMRMTLFVCFLRNTCLYIMIILFPCVLVSYPSLLSHV